MDRAGDGGRARALRGPRIGCGRRLGGSAALVRWDDLPEEYREASRAQARDTVAKLKLIGARVEAASAAEDQPGSSFTSAELDVLARREHERWMEHERSRGWSLGPRDDVHRTHPCLLPYDGLSQVEQQKDRDVVSEIPSLLRAAGRCIVRGS